MPSSIRDVCQDNAIFPFERIVDARVHGPLVNKLGFGGMLGQYAFGAPPRHPFLRSVLRYVRCASLDPVWAAVPATKPGDEDDDKTVHYTTGPAIVTRAYLEGGHLDSVHVLFGSPFGPTDPAGWGRFGNYAIHTHAGTWKRDKELNRTRLLARAAAHTEAGRHEEAGSILKRVGMHAASDLPASDVDKTWNGFFASYARSGRPAKAYLQIARDRVAAGQYEEAMRDLKHAQQMSAKMGQPELESEVHLLKSILIFRQAHYPSGEASRSNRTKVLSGRSSSAAHAQKQPYQDDANLTAIDELRKALVLHPDSTQSKLAWAFSRLQSSAEHAAEAIPELDLAIQSELGTRTDLLAPLSMPYTLYIWYTVPALRAAMRNYPNIAKLLDALKHPRRPDAHTQCDLETADSIVHSPSELLVKQQEKSQGGLSNSHSPTADMPPLNGVDRTVTTLRIADEDTHPVEPAEPIQATSVGYTSAHSLRINEYGVPSLVLDYE